MIGFAWLRTIFEHKLSERRDAVPAALPLAVGALAYLCLTNVVVMFPD
jgi:hypothetical protein